MGDTGSSSLPIRLIRAIADPALTVGILDLLARHEPYRSYPFGVMQARVTRQISHHAAVVVLRGVTPIAYFGGVLVARSSAESWHQSRGQSPFRADWEHGDAVVVTIVVSDHPRLLRPMARCFSRLYPNMKGYWKRVYTDGRQDSWRPPQSGR
jgi:hypothetical protein